MDVHLRGLASAQYDIVAGWQLQRFGWTRTMIGHRVRTHGWRVIHRGVYALNSAPLTRKQFWMAATLTSPNSFLSHASAGACWGFRPWPGSFETVTRPGSGGPTRWGGVLVARSRCLEGDVTRHDGLPITTAARTLIDLAPRLPEHKTRRAFREALRLRVTTRNELHDTIARHAGRPGTPLLAHLTARYGLLPYPRTRSDAEARALEILLHAGVELPLVNHRVGGEEADLTWLRQKLIIEIDGPQYHRFREEDARKQERWERAGFTVRRIPSDAVYDDPDRLIALATRR